jgi:hypothetical protein
MTLFARLPTAASSTYRALYAANGDYHAAARARCDDLWRDYEPFADPKFLRVFPLETHARWYEMYLTVTLLRNGLPVQRPPKPGTGPDVLLDMAGRRVWIEATCATGGRDGEPDSVPPLVYAAPDATCTAGAVPHDLIAMRITGALDAKQRAFSNYIATGLVRAHDLMVVAINVHDVPHGYFDMEPMMLRALYGIGAEVLHIDRDTRQIVAREHSVIESVPKRGTGNPVSMRTFVDGSVPHVSAVLGSRENVWNMPDLLGAGTRLHPNVTAMNPWPEGLLPVGCELSFAPAAEGWDLTVIR